MTYAVANWRALGSYVQLVVADGSRLGAARDLTVAMLDEVDRSYSRFRDDSDLVRANRGAGGWVTVSPLLVEAVEAALGAAAQTDGLVDPTLGLSLMALGYDRDLDQVRRQGERGEIRPTDLPTAVPARRRAWREVQAESSAESSDGSSRVRLPFDVALDLGATGKAFAADRIAAAIATTGTDCILSLGGDVAVGATRDGGPHAWQVAVSERPDSEPDELVLLPDGGLATSTTVHRTWRHGDREVHHLLDPATGQPVEPRWRTVSVRAQSCLAANTASTAAVVLGERAVDWLRRHGLAARLVGHDGAVLRIGGWAAIA